LELFKYTAWRPFNDENELIDNYYVKDNLINHQLFFNSATSFNDPFDLYPFLECNTTEKELLAKSIRIVRNNEHLNFREAKIKARKLIQKKNLHSEQGRQDAIERARTILRNIGVCCFTTNSPETILMWSHYGDQHKGICLVFDLPEDGFRYQSIPDPQPRLPVLGPVPIIYSGELPKANLFSYKASPFFKYVLTKSTEWAYENEYRAASYNQGLIKYDPMMLKAVIAGCKMQLREFYDLQKTITAMPHPVNLFKAVKKQDRFGLDLNPCIKVVMNNQPT
jgi:hypothetical protein